MSRRLLLEGLDFAGKSTLSRGLLGRFQEAGLQARISQNSLCPDNPIAPLASKVAHEAGRHPYEASALYLASHLWDMRHFPAELDRTGDSAPGVHIQDSCWLRSKAYDRRQGLELPWDRTGTVDFEVVIFLTASIPVRQWRCRKQRKDYSQHWVFARTDAFLALEHHLRREFQSHEHFLEIDTSQLSPNEVLEKAWAFVRRCMPLARDSAERRLNLLTCQG